MGHSPTSDCDVDPPAGREDEGQPLKEVRLDVFSFEIELERFAKLLLEDLDVRPRLWRRVVLHFALGCSREAVDSQIRNRETSQLFEID